MSAVLQLVNDPTIVESEEITKSSHALYLNVNKLSEENSYLRAEVRALREELAKVERTLGAQQALLNNARVREFELRSEFLKDRR
jgi:regulator of replication initiation timing